MNPAGIRIALLKGMEQVTIKNQDSALIKQLAGVGGALILVGAVAYWFTRRTIWGAKLQQAVKKHNPEHRFGEGTRDAVDQASWESFPASDPPAYH